MSRLPYLQRDQLDADGGAVWDAITSTRGSAVINEQGGLVGPFNAWVHAPDAGAILGELGAALRFRTSIERRLLEVAIITVGARWQAEFEWWAHARMAREQGVADEVIDAIGRDERPSFDKDDERIVHALAHQLVRTGCIDQPTYDDAHRLLGDRGMVELVSLCGYYTLVSFTLNAFEVPLPPGIAVQWSR